MKKCPKCNKEFIEIEKGILKPTCEHFPDDLRLIQLKK